MPKYRGKDGNRGKADAANDPEAARTANPLYWNLTNPPNHYQQPASTPPAGRIEPEGHPPINGRWFAQYFDRAAGIRYSIAITPENRFFVLAVNDQTRAVNWLWFENGSAVRQSEALPEALKRRPESSNRLGAWPDELDP